jgi:hypothetical protein
VQEQKEGQPQWPPLLFCFPGLAAEQTSGVPLAPLIVGVGEYHVFAGELPFSHKALRRE